MKKLAFMCCAALGLAAPWGHADYSQHPEAGSFVATMVDEHGWKKENVLALLSEAEKKQSILDAISRPAEKTKAWHEYRKIFLGKSRIDQGVEFWNQYKDTLESVSKQYQVPVEIIVAIIGVETRYGRHAGSYRVLDALATLGFDYPKRAKFFRQELAHFLLLTKEQNQDPLGLKGSYAGAMGYGQFIPSSYRRYAADFTDDGVADIWENPHDAIASVANYFKEHGWKDGEPVLVRARFQSGYDDELVNKKSRPSMTLAVAEKEHGFTPVEGELDKELKITPLVYQGKKGAEFWLGFNNYYVITRYNRSRLYAMAVWQLSEEIKEHYRDASRVESLKNG